MGIKVEVETRPSGCRACIVIDERRFYGAYGFSEVESEIAREALASVLDPVAPPKPAHWTASSKQTSSGNAIEIVVTYDDSSTRAHVANTLGEAIAWIHDLYVAKEQP